MYPLLTPLDSPCGELGMCEPPTPQHKRETAGPLYIFCAAKGGSRRSALERRSRDTCPNLAGLLGCPVTSAPRAGDNIPTARADEYVAIGVIYPAKRSRAVLAAEQRDNSRSSRSVAAHHAEKNRDESGQVGHTPETLEALITEDGLPGKRSRGNRSLRSRAVRRTSSESARGPVSFDRQDA
jgi:hypothetical protein